MQACNTHYHDRQGSYNTVVMFMYSTQIQTGFYSSTSTASSSATSTG